MRKATTMTTPTLFTYVLFALCTLGVSGVYAKGSAADLARIRSAKGGALRSGSSASSRIGAPAVNVAPAPGKSVVFAPLSFKKDDFAVDGSKIPLLKEKVQDSYAGQLPVTADEGEIRKLFFWYWPTSAKNGSDTLTIWLNGGPGCSSMTGLLSELGPFTYMPGADAPSVNKYAWSSVSDMLFVDQPVGTGFSNGTSDVRNEYDVADRFYGFLVAFYSTFPELLKKKLFISGESYAGFYIPYIAQRIVDASDEEKKATPIDLQSILINDGVYSDFVIGEYAPTARWARKRNDVLKIPEDILKNVEAASEECGFESLMNQASYPPKGPLLWDASTANSRTCWTFDTIYEAANQVNSCFNIYDITQQCPTPVDPIEPYFNRPEVQELLHVPNYGNWSQCGGHGNIFPDNMDQSPYTETLFPGLIAALPRGVTLWHGLDDMILLAEGTRVTIQNMTWGGLQGFQSEPTQKLELDGKNYGVQHTERGLTYYEVVDAGHMVPADQPALSLEILKTVLGKGGNFVTSAASGTSSGSGSGSSANSNSSANANGGNGGGNGGDDAAGRVGVSMITVAGVVVAAFMMMF